MYVCLCEHTGDPLQSRCKEIQSLTLSTVFALKICHPLCTKNLSFKAIRPRMKKTFEGDEHLDFLDETLEQRQIIRMHS